MTPQQPTSKDLAERLARKCALEFISWAKDDKHPLAAKLEQIVSTQTALPELLECAEAAKTCRTALQKIADITDETRSGWALKAIDEALTALEAKLKEILKEVEQ